MQSTSFLISQASVLSNTLKEQVINLIVAGGQIKANEAKVGLHRALLVALCVLDRQVIATASIKNPRSSYYDTISKLAAISLSADDFPHELGYIVTKSGFEGRKLCQSLISQLLNQYGKAPLFATTRKAEMCHILTKFGFKEFGKKYKDDLQILIAKA